MPTSQTMYRITAGALIGSAVLSLLGGLAHPIVHGESHSIASMTEPIFPYAHLVIYVGAVLLMIGLPGMFVWLSSRASSLALIGTALYFVANAVSAQASLVVEAFITPALAADPGARHLIGEDGAIAGDTLFNTAQAVAGLFFVSSLLILGIGLLRSPAIPRWIGVVLTIGALVLFVPLPEVPMLEGLQIELARGIAVAAIGLLMLRTVRGDLPKDIAARRESLPA